MDLAVFSEGTAGGITQYSQPLNFELAGKNFLFVMDDGIDYELRVLDKHMAEWRYAGGEFGKAAYMCQKADEDTYLLFFELGCKPRKSHTFVIDLRGRLVTRIIGELGLNPKNPYLNKTSFEFGAIMAEGESLPFERHGYTSDMIGNCVKWVYSCEMATVHVYYCADYYRITYPRDPESVKRHEMREQLNAALKELPSSDEPAVYVKIKDGMYLFSLTESNMERLLGERGVFRSNTMCMLQNYKTLYQVGRAFGTMTENGKDIEIATMFSAYGQLLKDFDQFFFTDPNPYLV